jgi:hypothetical protein
MPQGGRSNSKGMTMMTMLAIATVNRCGSDYVFCFQIIFIKKCFPVVSVSNAIVTLQAGMQ